MQRHSSLQTIAVHNGAVTLYVPDAAMVQQAYLVGNTDFPYWSKVWPAAVALSEFLVSHPLYIKNKTVLELAAGLGLPSLAAARYAAWVVCSDYVPEAVEMAGRSAAYNLLRNFSTRLLDWHSLPRDLIADVLLLSDVSYDASLFRVQEKAVRRFLESGTTVIMATPQRLVARGFVNELLSFCTAQEDQEMAGAMLSVMVMRKRYR